MNTFKSLLVGYTLFSSAFFLTTTVSAQQANTTTNNNAVAAAAPNGIWVYLGNVIPKNAYYLIERRRSGEQRYDEIGRAMAPFSSEEINQRNEKWHPFFDKLDILSDQQKQKIWNYLLSNTRNDSLYVGNLPLVNLIIGTGYLDESVEAEMNYQYKVSLISKEGTTLSISETNIVKWPVKPDILQPQLKENRETKQATFIQWYVPEQKDLSHFNVYRSIYGKDEFVKNITERGFNTNQDSVFMLTFDRYHDDPSLYEYYVEPVDIYGNAGPLSDLVSAGSVSKQYEPTISFFRAFGQNANHEIRLEWHFKTKPFIQSISIMRSMHYDSGFVNIANLPPDDTAYIDKVSLAGENYYYYLVVKGPKNTSLPSAVVSAMFTGYEEKPMPPDEVAAEGTNEGVKVYWLCNEPYIQGFFVFRSAGFDFKQASDLIPFDESLYIFYDTSSVLQGGEVYNYTIRTVDDHFRMSDFSDTVSAIPEKHVMVSTPINLRFRIENGKVFLIWDDLQISEEKLLGYKVYRRLQSDLEYQLINELNMRSEQNYFVDSIFIDGLSYEYAVSAYDYFSNESVKSHSVLVKIDAQQPGVPSITEVIADQGGVLIAWGQLGSDDVSQVRVYRSQPGTESILIGSTDAGNQAFNDRTALKGQLYFYQIASLSTNNRESTKSEKVGIRPL